MLPLFAILTIRIAFCYAGTYYITSNNVLGDVVLSDSRKASSMISCAQKCKREDGSLCRCTVSRNIMIADNTNEVIYEEYHKLKEVREFLKFLSFQYISISI